MSKPTNKLALAASLLAPLALWACANGGGEAPGKDAAADKGPADGSIQGTPVEGEGKVARAPGSAATEKEYTLQIDPSDVSVGEEGKISIRVIPQGEWHMNLEYPTKLQIDPPDGITVAKAKLDKADAVKLDEQSCEFAISYTAAEAGAKTFTGEFKFAICQDEACVPKTEKLQFEVAVK
jgi:hypothetical protein